MIDVTRRAAAWWTRAWRSHASDGTADMAAPAGSRPLLFISDLHLSPAIPHTVAAFTHFIEVTAATAQAVYILGDLFEYWIGDDELSTPWAIKQCELLRSLSTRGIALYIMHGNRDFLLGARFTAAASATLLHDPCVLEAFERKFVLTHGDALCTLDLSYQRLRRIIRHRWVQRCFLSWPLAWRLVLARKLRNRPMQIQTHNPMWDVTNEAVAQLFEDSGARTMIHGHTHWPARHRQGNHERWVLPDWDLDHGAARGGYLQLDATGLRALPLDSNGPGPS
jgi:UDP-2,3-diacylglucosamine hydrolase